MNAQIYIIISIAVLAVIALFVFFFKKNRKAKRFTPLAGLAFAFVLAGIIFGSTRIAGYSLMGVGIALAVIDAILKLKKK